MLKTAQKAAACIVTVAAVAFGWCALAYATALAHNPNLLPFWQIGARVGINALMHACPLFEALCYATGLFI